tara:strand:- start:80 stop:310 length:231 start_codon:yes stop_codon:yes gene_type:complete
MKITKAELRELIKEELDSAMEEGVDYDYMYNDFFTYISNYGDLYRLPGKRMLDKINNAIQYAMQHHAPGGPRRSEE